MKLEKESNPNPAETATSERFYSLDALRGIMMLLGIVLHSALTYAAKAKGTAWLVRDPDMNIYFKETDAFIHAFRMPVFFVTAGFFGALLFYKKGPLAMLKNRFKRIVLPFIAGVLLVWPLVILAGAFSMAKFGIPLNPTGKAVSLLSFLFKMGHLWFLYFLAIISVAFWFLALLFKENSFFTKIVNQSFSYMLKRFSVRLLILSLCYFLMLIWMGTTGILTSDTWVPNFIALFMYFIFFGLGWMIYKTDRLQYLKTNSIGQLAVATLLFFIPIIVNMPDEASSLLIKQSIAAISGTLFIFGFIAFFLTYLDSYSKHLSYLMDASYWVYIIHLPIVLLIPGLLAGSGLPVVIKFIITLSGTIVISMLSYKYLVRGTFIGMFLNGKVHKTRKLEEVVLK